MTANTVPQQTSSRREGLIASSTQSQGQNVSQIVANQNITAQGRPITESGGFSASEPHLVQMQSNFQGKSLFITSDPL